MEHEEEEEDEEELEELEEPPLQFFLFLRPL